MPAHDYRPFIGLPYKPPFGCFDLAAQIFERCYGVDLWPIESELELPVRVQNLHDVVLSHCHRVTDPVEGDLVLIRTTPWHVGVVVDPGWMIHSYEAEGYGQSVFERYDGLNYRNNIEGFYRYVG